MKLIIGGVALAFCAGVAVQPAAAIVSELEPNNSILTAQDLEALFVLSPDPTIPEGTTIPHVSVAGTGDGTDDYYTFLVPTAGLKGIFDIDGTSVGDDLFLALALFDAQGNPVVLDSDDNTAIPDPGSNNPLDPFLTTVFPSVGQYYLIVTRGGPNIGKGILPGTSYRLNVSVEGHARTGEDLPADANAIPEPASAALAIMGLASLATALRRRR